TTATPSPCSKLQESWRQAQTVSTSVVSWHGLWLPTSYSVNTHNTPIDATRLSSPGTNQIQTCRTSCFATNFAIASASANVASQAGSLFNDLTSRSTCCRCLGFLTVNGP